MRLRDWLSKQDQQTIDRIARNFWVLQVREQDIKRLIATDPLKTAVVISPDKAGEIRDRSMHVLRSIGPNLPSGTHHTRNHDVQLHAAYRLAYENARRLGVTEMVVTPICAHTRYPREAAAWVMIQAALDELALPNCRLHRLELSAFDPYAPDPNHEAMARIWCVASDVLKSCRTPVGDFVVNPPRSMMRHAGNAPVQRDASGRYIVQLPHMQYPVVSYHRLDSGYFHVEQRGHNCSMHVHDGLSMFYSGHDLRYLASTDDIDEYITQQAQMDPYDPNPGRRTTLYSFFDLARYSKHKLPYVLPFNAANGAITVADAQAGRPIFSWWGAAPNIDQAPAIGVTMQVSSGDGQIRSHSVQLIELQGQPRHFVEVDSQRDPDCADTPPRTVRADTMSEALARLLPFVARDALGAYTIDVYCPAPETLAAWQSRGGALPQAPAMAAAAPPAPSRSSIGASGSNAMHEQASGGAKQRRNIEFVSVHAVGNAQPVYQSSQSKVVLYAQDHKGVLEELGERLDMTDEDVSLYRYFLWYLETAPTDSQGIKVDTVRKFRNLVVNERNRLVESAIAAGLRKHLRSTVNRIDGLGLKIQARQNLSRTRSGFALTQPANQAAVKSIPTDDPLLRRNDKSRYRDVLLFLERKQPIGPYGRVTTIDQLRQLDTQQVQDLLTLGGISGAVLEAFDSVEWLLRHSQP
ncbi:MAG TPA: hypothetical protein VF169_24990 [Albitalea sp.]|uniref:hypothetical protein n=1 Tax=Piscinibacter sp. TaxID=1903157 RepID=UPI002ED1935D